MGLGEQEGHLYKGPRLGIGTINMRHILLLIAFVSISPITGKGHVYSNYINPILKLLVRQNMLKHSNCLTQGSNPMSQQWKLIKSVSLVFFFMN